MAQHHELGEAMFFWKVPPTVIFGRNQVMSAEVNLDWCRTHGVQTYRRKSGGGCVYSDEGNLMISYVSSETEVGTAFGSYLGRLARALQGLGAAAEVSGRNDVMIDGKKVSGNAFQLLGDRSIIHGTLLYDSDFDALQQAITPSESKVHSKGVSSVRQHVTNLRPHIGRKDLVHDMDSLTEYLSLCLCDSVVLLDGKAIAGISEIEKTYLNPAFIAGHETAYSVRSEGRIAEVGEIIVDISLVDGKISEVHLSGDYFALRTPQEVDSALTAALRGLSPDGDSTRGALAEVDLTGLIPHLTAEALAGILLKD